MLKGNAVHLTEVRREDSEIMYRWINDAETVRFNAPYLPVTWSGHSAWFDNLGKDSSKIVLAIRETAGKELIGVVQLIDIHPIHRSAELTTRIGDAAKRGKGYGTEALRLTLDFAWRDLNLQRVWLRVFASNERAIRAYARAGFLSEGRMRRAAWVNGGWEDQIVMAALRNE